VKETLAFVSALAIVGCADTATAPPAQTAQYAPPAGAPYAYPPPAYGAPQPAPYGAPQQAPYGAPQQAPYGAPQPVPYGASQQGPYGAPQSPAYGTPPGSTAPGPLPTGTPAAPPQAAPAPWALPAPSLAGRPLLGPLIGPAAWQAEARAVAGELVANLAPQNQARVASIPLVFDPNPNEVNAFAGCDETGAPFVAGTEGLLEAIDGISQTKASDELYGSQTYEAYVGVVAPRLVTKDGGSAMLPAGIVPLQAWLDPRRISRAHEIFDEIVAFTFGHELSHHYLGHTGCANGQTSGFGPAIAQLGQLAASVMPLVNQPNEAAADTSGCINLLDAGRARSPAAYPWTEEGGLWLLDFFARLDRASGANPWLGFLRTHPNPALRIPLAQVTAATWRLQHPG
jgi:hypothetical protein